MTQRRRGLELGPHERHAVVPLERRLPGQHLHDSAGQRVLVGPAVDRLALDLLGRDVVERAEELAGGGERRRGERVLAEPEVGQVDVIGAPLGGVEQYVAWLDVAVHEAVGVRGVQRRGSLGGDRGGPGRARLPSASISVRTSPAPT